MPEIPPFDGHEDLDIPNYPVQAPCSISDNEFINMVRDFIGDQSMKKQVEFYLKHNQLTPKAKHKIVSFLLFAVNPSITISNIPNPKEAQKLRASYKLMRAGLPIGLTRFDENDAYLHIIAAIDHAYRNQIYRASGGFTMKRIGTTTSEIRNDTNTRFQEEAAEKQGLFSKLRFTSR